MLRQITIRLHDRTEITFGTHRPEAEFPFAGLGDLLGLAVEERPDAAGAPDAELILPEDVKPETQWVERGPCTSAAMLPDGGHIQLLCYRRPPSRRRYYRLCIWQMGLGMGVMNAVLRGVKAVLAHCAVLETEGGAVLLFGESGMGKSTAVGRWRAEGGKSISDDTALLDFSGGGEILVRRMPTWSACREKTNEGNYPSEEELRLIGVLALGRSESGDDEIVELSAAQYFAQCYRSMFYWNLFYQEVLTEPQKRLLAERMGGFTQIITGRFPPRALLTALEGKALRSVIETYLNTMKPKGGA